MLGRPWRGVEPRNGGKRRTHLHGLVAGSLFVIAFFLMWTVPAALERLLRGDVTWASVIYPALFSLMLGGGIREARAWRRGTRPANARPG